MDILNALNNCFLRLPFQLFLLTPNIIFDILILIYSSSVLIDSHMEMRRIEAGRTLNFFMKGAVFNQRYTNEESSVNA